MQTTQGPGIPIRLAPGRFWLWGAGLSLMSAILIVGSPWNGWVDFPQFWYAGRLVGTSTLIDPLNQNAWAVANGYQPFPFLYPPGTAWLYFPLQFLPLAGAFWVNAGVTALIALASGWVAARTFDLDTRVAMVATLAWAPVLGSAALGHSAPLALLLGMIAIYGLRNDRQFLAGLAVGGILFKPTMALPLLALLMIRRQWRAIPAVALVAIGWYVLGVAGSAGDWLWPRDWLAFTAPFFGADLAHNMNKTIGIAELLMGHGAPSYVGYAAAVGVALLALPRLLRSPIVEAAAAACLVGLLVSPHSLSYEAVMALPFLLWAAGTTGAGIAEPWRTRLLIAAYAMAPLFVVTPFLGFSVFIVIVGVGCAIWIGGWQRQDAVSEPAAAAGARHLPGFPRVPSLPGSRPAPSGWERA